MSDSEKPLKIISFIVSGLMAASALLFLVLGRGKPTHSEGVLEFSAPASFNPSELTNSLNAFRKDQGFLKQVATRSGFALAGEPEFDRLATSLANRMDFKLNWNESSIVVQFSHRKSATAANVADAIAVITKENLELQRQEHAEKILRQEEAVEDRRKLLEQIRRIEALNAFDSQNGAKSEALRNNRRAQHGYAAFVDAGGDYDEAVRKLDELKTKPMVSVGAIRAATISRD